MKKSTILSFLLTCFFCISYANPFPVTLKVVDKTKGEVTNDTNDANNNEANIFVWLDDNLKALNPTKTNEWWWPMYNDASFTNFTNGVLNKTADAWEWTLPLQVSPGTYEWNPHAKSLGWKSINEGMYTYGATNNLSFTVGANGELGGDYELVIDPSSQQKFSITLKVIDYTKGEMTDAPGTWAQDANIIAWVTESINPMFGKPNSNFWFYGFYDKTVNWENSGTMVTYPDGKLIKDSDKWTWQATFEAAPGVYEWNPQSIVHGWASLTGGNVAFTVSATGELSGKYEVKLGGGDDGEIRVACIGDSNTAGAGVSNYLEKAWPIQLRDYLPEEYGTKNLGISGATLMAFPDPWGAWENNASYVMSLKSYTPNIILIALGTNDSKTGYWGTRNFKQEYSEFIDRYKTIESDPEFYMVMPIKALDNSFGISNNNIINGVIPAIREISKEKMIPVIDWYSLTASATNTDLPDGVHANDETSRKMAEKAAQILLTSKPAIALNGTPSSTTYAEYRWYLNGTLISGATTNTYNATQAGTYNVAVKLTSSADDVLVSSSFELIASSGTLVVGDKTTSINDVGNTADVNFAYSSGQININNADAGTLYIYNVSGKLLEKVVIKGNNTILDVNYLPSGLFICKVIKENNSYVEKLIK